MTNEPKQKTPQGYEIPIPRRADFFGNLTKAAKPPTPSRSRKARSRRTKKK